MGRQVFVRRSGVAQVCRLWPRLHGGGDDGFADLGSTRSQRALKQEEFAWVDLVHSGILTCLNFEATVASLHCSRCDEEDSHWLRCISRDATQPEPHNKVGVVGSPILAALAASEPLSEKSLPGLILFI